MNQPVYRRSGGHRILENLLPLGKRKIACNRRARSLISVGQQSEQHLHFFAVLLNVTDVVDDERLISSQFFQELWKKQIPFCTQQLLSEKLTILEKYPMPLQNQFVCNGAQGVAFAVMESFP